MIEIGCCSAKTWEAPESSVGQPIHCEECGAVLQLVSAEPIAEGAGAGDFDAELVTGEGSTLPAARYLLGGSAEISLGKSPECNIILPGKLVSRRHCKLVRLDFGPSRWTIVDEKSTNGLFVNGQRVTEHELADGDAIRIGEFGFSYRVNAGVQEESISPFEMLAPATAAEAQQSFANTTSGDANPMATAGMVLGFIFCIPVCSILAIIFSAIGLSKSKQPGVGGRRHALIGLTCGIIGCGFVPLMLLISILLPALNRAREMANRVKCQSNMRVIGQALQMYENAYQNVMPSSLDALAQAENLPAATLICPDGNSENYVLTDGRVWIGGERILLYEPMSNHQLGINVLFGDGSVKFMPNPAGQQIIDAAAAESGSSDGQAVQRTFQPPSWAPTQPPQLPALPSADDQAAELEKIAAAWHQQGSVQDLLGDMTGSHTVPDPGQPTALKTGERLTTPTTFKPPVTFQIVLLSDLADTRIGYAFGQIIFNWEMHQNELRVDGGPDGGLHPKPGVGQLPQNQWVGIELTVTPTEAIIYANGQEIDRLPGDYSAIDEPFYLEAHNGPVEVKSVKVVK